MDLDKNQKAANKLAVIKENKQEILVDIDQEGHH